METKKDDNNLVFDDYRSVFYTLHGILDNSYYNSVNPFAPNKLTNSEYSLSTPAFQFTTNEKEEVSLIYIIEINHIISNDIIHSWIRHSEKCNFLCLFVPNDISSNVESLLASKISNYKVCPFHFEKKGKNNRNVIIEL